MHCLTSSTVRYSVDGWSTSEDIMTLDSGLGVHYADLPTDKLLHGDCIEYTFFWHDAEVWEPRRFQMKVNDPALEALEAEQQQRDRIRVYLPS
jgi:glucoamylase